MTLYIGHLYRCTTFCVKKRLMNTIRDNIISGGSSFSVITSGSRGEGLDLKNSDFDVMLVDTDYIVHEDTGSRKLDPQKINLIMEINDTKPGFTQLRFVDLPPSGSITEMCTYNGKSWFLPSYKWKYQFINEESIKFGIDFIHGPCLSDRHGSFDIACCLHNPNWISLAEEWITRPNRLWPIRDVKLDIIEHGVLYVPIGCKGSDNEELEWRISFSVAEKLLIYSFSHTQLICYTLMKILLKDVIDNDSGCKDLLCSYFIKTIILCVSEETILTEWKPANLIQYFMRCLGRLLYCVKYSMCPHYFIPTINMFENKIEGQSRKLLLGHLNTLFSIGWRCVLLSEKLQNFTNNSNTMLLTSEIQGTQMQLLLPYRRNCHDVSTLHKVSLPVAYRRLIRLLNISKSYFIKSYYSRALSYTCSYLIPHSSIGLVDINKKVYSQKRTQQSYLLQNLNHDPVSGWLMLAAFFYKIKQYNNALLILSYVMMKFTPEKIYYQNCLSQLQLNLIRSKTFQRLGILRFFKHQVISEIIFSSDSTLIPKELTLECSNLCSFPPVAFSHFLCFLCHYHLHDKPQCYESIKDLQLTIDEEYFIFNADEKAMGYYLMGIALQLIGQNNLAEKAFKDAIECDNDLNAAAERLSMMYSNFDRNK